MKIKIFKLPIMIAMSALIFCSSPAFSEGVTPQTSVESFLDAIRAMEFPVKDVAHQAELVKTASRFVDLGLVGQRAVAAHWDLASKDQQLKFLDLFSKLIEKTAYPRSHDFLGNLKIIYSEPVADATGTTVKSVVQDPSQGLDTEVIYHLIQKEGQWIVDDVILDEVSIVEDLKYQFDKLIKDSSFDGLLVKMQERLDQADKPETPAAA